jgi:Zn-dependent metalloprotease
MALRIWSWGVVVLFGATLVCSAVQAQQTDEAAGAVIDAIKKDNPDASITINPTTGLPSSITNLTPNVDPSAALAASRNEAGDPSEADVRNAVETWLATGVLSAGYSNKKAQNVITEVRKDNDIPDRSVAKIEQRLNNIPVFGSSAKVSVEQSLAVSTFTGSQSKVDIETTTPKITEDQADAAARAKIDEINKTEGEEVAPMPLAPESSKGPATYKLVIFDPKLFNLKDKGGTRLAWLVSIETYRVFVDALTGEVFHYYIDQPSGMIRRLYDLSEQSTFPGTMMLDEEKKERSEAVPEDAVEAFINTGLVRDFYYLVLGRDGVDDTDGSGPKGGGVMESYVRHGTTRNAFWCTGAFKPTCPKADVMVYGPGFAGALDIVGHEITHGVIIHQTGLKYFSESGAVNESLADIFGTLIELQVKGAGGNWVIGESLPGSSVQKPLRSMSDPTLKDEAGKSQFDKTAKYSSTNRGQPDYYADIVTTSDALCGTQPRQDNGCVHFNSGILNKFAYLISEGGEHRGSTVTGIGRYKLARIAYRALTEKVTDATNLVQAADGFVLSCAELASRNLAGITDADCQQVKTARQAVGLYLGS